MCECCYPPGCQAGFKRVTPRNAKSEMYRLAVFALPPLYEASEFRGMGSFSLIRRMSPVAWQHVNLSGSFEIGDEDPIVDMQALAAHYADSAFWR